MNEGIVAGSIPPPCPNEKLPANHGLKGYIGWIGLCLMALAGLLVAEVSSMFAVLVLLGMELLGIALLLLGWLWMRSDFFTADLSSADCYEPAPKRDPYCLYGSADLRQGDDSHDQR